MLIDQLAAGFSLDEFLVTMPSLERGQPQRFMEQNPCTGDFLSLAFCQSRLI
jgi:hypothetical protein